MFATGPPSTIAAAAGQTLTLGGPSFNLGVASAIFGSAIDTGTVVLAPTSSSGGNPASIIEVAGGTLRFGNALSANIGSNLTSVTVDAGATLDLNDFNAGVNTLLGAGAVTTGANAATTLSLTGNGNFSGAITGAGQVNVVSGTTIFTGTNLYSGGTTIGLGSTLQLGNGGATGSIIGNVIDSGRFAINRSDTFTFGGNISGTGAFQQIGIGTAILTGTNTYSGSTTVNGGTLEVDGTIANTSSVTVNSGATLSGTGTVDPPTVTIMNGGTLAPGNASNPTGTLTIAGNLAFQPGALYVVQVTPATASATAVTGSASLTGGTVNAQFAPGTYLTKQYTILTAASGLGGTTFAGLSNTNLPAGFTDSLSYSGNSAFLNLTATLGAPSTGVLPAGLNPNQQNVAGAINNFFNAGGALPPSFVSLFGLTGGALANALTQLSGESATGAERAVFQLGDQFLNVMLDPFVTGRGSAGVGVGGPALAFAPEQEANLPPDVALAYAPLLYKTPPKPIYEPRWTAWGAGYGGTNNASGDATVGSNNVTASTYGGAAGMDYHFTPDTVAGFALAGAGTNWNLVNGLGNGRSDAFQAGVYGMSWFGAAYLAGAFDFSNHWFSTSRGVLSEQLTASFIGQSYGGRLEGGCRWLVLPAVGITPYGAVQAQSFHTPGYSETNPAGGFGLAYAAQNASDVRTELGARFDDPTLVYGKPLILFGRVAWAHDFVDNPTLSAAFETLPGAGFTVFGARIAHDSALTSAGAKLFLSPSWMVMAKFDGEFASKSETYAGTGTLRYTW
jgi:autotransporter-associated beta strand protein